MISVKSKTSNFLQNIFFIFASLFCMSAIISCSAITDKKDDGTLSFDVPASLLARSADDTQESASIKLTISGDYSYTQTFTKDSFIDETCNNISNSNETINTITVDEIPVGSKIIISLEVYKNSILFFEGKSDEFVVQPSQNNVSISLDYPLSR